MLSQIKSKLTEEKMQIPLWFRINKSEFDELTGDIYDNQDNKDFKITIDKKNVLFKKKCLSDYKEVPKKTIAERNIAESVKLRKRRIAENEEEEKNINNKLLKEYFTNYRRSSDMYKKLRMTEGERNEDQVSICNQKSARKNEKNH